MIGTRNVAAEKKEQAQNKCGSSLSNVMQIVKHEHDNQFDSHRKQIKIIFIWMYRYIILIWLNANCEISIFYCHAN